MKHEQLPGAETNVIPECAVSREKNRLERLLKRYVRRSACTAAAGMGAFGLVENSSEAAINLSNTLPFVTNKLTGSPIGYVGGFEWATSGFNYYYDPNGGYGTTDAFGLDVDGNGTGDVNIFRGFNYYGYITVGTYHVGYSSYTTSKIRGSDDVRLLSNADNPDIDGLPSQAGKELLQGFNAGEVIGDNDSALGFGNEAVARGAYSYGDWDGVPYNAGVYPNNTGDDVSYIGFQIDLDQNTTIDGFGWIEVVVREVAWNPEAPSFFSHPEIVVKRWAYTDDGSPIIAGDTGTADSDFNEDGSVDGIDFLNWQRGRGVGTTKAEGDADDNQIVNGLDLGIWESEYSANPLQSTLGAVPEPSSLTLLAAGAGAYAFRRRRRA